MTLKALKRGVFYNLKITSLVIGTVVCVVFNLPLEWSKGGGLYHFPDVFTCFHGR